jgi:AAA family ATP:ADP antiporter
MNLKQFIDSHEIGYKKNLLFFLLSYFFVLLNYPLVRASTTAMFFESFGAKSSPQAWMWAIGFLTLSIWFCNWLQKRLSVQIVFAVISLISAMVFVSGQLSFITETKYFSYGSFVWKEICIVMQVHLLLGYANNYFSRDQFRKLLGPVGAVGSLGGILGGVLTSYVSETYGTTSVLLLGVGFVVLPLIFFLMTSHVRHVVKKHDSPLASLDTSEIRFYVGIIALIVVLTQFIINISDFRFNLEFEKIITNSDLRTSYLGSIYTWTNLITFIFQFLFLPFLLPRIHERHLHIFLPVSFFIGLIVLIVAPQTLWPIASVYVYFKAADYSFFSAGKELLYQPLRPEQKYGAKYLTDMLVYRGGKAIIALILIYLQSSFILNMMMGLFLLCWIGAVLRLFKLHQKLFH